jgi:acyl carrier protein
MDEATKAGAGAAPAPDRGSAAEILDILARETGVAAERLRPEARLEDLEIESLDMMQAVFALETRYDISIPLPADQAIGADLTLGAFIERIQEQIRTAGA